MKRLLILLFMLFGLAYLSVPLAAKGDERPVNVILIYLDDMGYGDLSVTGSGGYTTPNIDRMADHGIFFTHYYSPQAVCSASRAGVSLQPWGDLAFL